VAPELDAIVARATAPEPGDRFPSVRAMHEAIESFLDGERDAERRRELAAAHLKTAREALARASLAGDDAEARRAEGMRELGRAVALDPSDESALRTITDLVLAPADDLPPAAMEQLRAGERVDRARASRRTSLMYLVWLGFVPLLWFMGVRSWAELATIATLIVLSSAHARWVGASSERAEPSRLLGTMVLNFTLVGACSLIFGPLVFVPGVAATSAAGYVIAVREKSWLRAAPFVLAICAVFVPLALEHFGVLPRAYSFDEGVITVHPVIADFRATPTALSLAIVTLVQLILPAVIISRAVDGLVDAERRNFAQAWRLRQLLP
jgi:serine/threonine-protein kinase